MSTIYFDNLKFLEDVTYIGVDGRELTYVTGDTYMFTEAYNHTVNFSFTYGNIPDGMFAYCDDILSAYVHEDSCAIGAYAFMHCRNLESVYLPSTVTYIGTYAFYNDDSETAISYFDITSYNPPVLGTNVFGECEPEVIHVPEERVSYYKEAEGWSDYSENINPEPAQINYVTAAFNVTSAPQTVKLWQSNSNIKSIKIDSETLPSLTQNYTFDTTGRHEVKYELLDDTTLPEKMFTECPLNELYLPDSITTIGDNALMNNNMTEFVVPENVTSIGENLCGRNYNLTNLVIKSKGSLNIGKGLLCFNNTIAGNLTLPQTLRSLGSLVYYGAKKPNYVSLLVTYMDNLHNNLACEQIKNQINLPVRLVDENLNEIFDVVIPEDTSVVNPSIAAYAFYNCTRVKTITFNNATPPKLGTAPFGNMTALTAIYVPKNSVDAYKTAWSNYANLIQAIPEIIDFADSTVKSLCVQNWDTNFDGELDTTEAAAVNSLGTVFMQNTTITSFNELSYFTGLTTIPSRAFNGCSNITSITLPETITTIQNDAFSESPKLTYINIPSGVTSMGPGLFFGCNKLNNITIPESITVIGQHTFNGCWAFTEVILPPNLTSIGDYAFQACIGLTEMTIPEGVTSIGNYTFDGCSKIETMTFNHDTPPKLGNNAFRGMTALTAIYVPPASVDVYKAASGWSNYANLIQAIPQERYTINYSIKAMPQPNATDYYQNILNEYAFTTYDEQTGESNFSKENFDAVIDSISLDGVKIDVETGEELRRTFTEEGLHNVELNLVGPTVPSNIFSSVPVYECHVEEGITTIGRGAFTEGWQQTTGGKLYLPSTITEFQDMPFTMCGAFKLYMNALTPPVYNPETEGANLFEGDYYIIFVPDAAVDTYKAAPNWSQYASNIRGFSAAKTNLDDRDFGFFIDEDNIQGYYDANISEPAGNTSFGLDYFANSYGVEFTLKYDTTMFTVDSWNWFTVIDVDRWTSASNTYTITIEFDGDDAFNAKTLTYNVITEVPEKKPSEEETPKE